jgi:2,3-bisphosphoglycerate-dependent phosphoglycerate mutase
LATAKPLATEFKLIPVIYDGKDLTVIANKALTENKGKTALIVGHSNTLIPVIEALKGIAPFEELTDDDYDMLFKVVIDQSGKATVTINRYGVAHHATDLKNKKEMYTPMN